MILFNKINPQVLEQLEILHLNLSHLYALESILYDINTEVPSVVLKTLERKGYITINNNFLCATETGKKLHEMLSNPSFSIVGVNVKKEIKKIKGDTLTNFEKFWELYPASDKWGNFPLTRTLRTKKEDCERKYAEAVAGGFTHEMLCSALEYEINTKKRASKLGQNKLSFMVNSLTWFNNPDSYKDYYRLSQETKKEQVNETIDTKELF